MNEREASVRSTLKLALEALETLTEGHSLGGKNLGVEAIAAIKEALAQPEQEPVAWRNAAIRVGEDLCSVGPFGYYDMTAAQWLDWALSVVTVHAPPPQRTVAEGEDKKTWVGLTDEEIKHLVQSTPYEDEHLLVEKTEALLKEKNT